MSSASSSYSSASSLSADKDGPKFGDMFTQHWRNAFITTLVWFTIVRGPRYISDLIRLYPTICSFSVHVADIPGIVLVAAILATLLSIASICHCGRTPPKLPPWVSVLSALTAASGITIHVIDSTDTNDQPWIPVVWTMFIIIIIRLHCTNSMHILFLLLQKQASKTRLKTSTLDRIRSESSMGINQWKMLLLPKIIRKSRRTIRTLGIGSHYRTSTRRLRCIQQLVTCLLAMQPSKTRLNSFTIHQEI
jgi:hypothetical protein